MVTSFFRFSCLITWCEAVRSPSGCFTAFFLSFMLIIITIIMITMIFKSFLLAMAETAWVWSVFVALPPTHPTPPTRGKNTDPNQILSRRMKSAERQMTGASLTKNQKQLQVISSRSCNCRREQVEATTVKQNFHWSIIQSRALNRFWFLKFVSGRQKSSDSRGIKKA